MGTPNKDYTEILRNVVKFHVESFNFAVGKGLKYAIADSQHFEIDLPKEHTLHYWIQEATFGTPQKDDITRSSRLFPVECREGYRTYGAPLNVTIAYRVDGGEPIQYQCKFDNVPIMVKSDKCHLKNLKPIELVQKGEEIHEMGGYFIINGLERAFRSVLQIRRNFPVCLERDSFKNRGDYFSQYGIYFRSVRKDETGGSNIFHYLTDGTVKVSMLVKSMYFVSIILLMKALKETTDKEIFEKIVAGRYDNSFITERAEVLISETRRAFPDCKTRDQCLEFLGSRFRVDMRVSKSLTDKQVGEEFLKRYLLVHLDSSKEKFDLLLLCLQKLYAYVAGEISADTGDTVPFQEVSLAGHMYLGLLKFFLESYLERIEFTIKKDMNRSDRDKTDFTTEDYIKAAFAKSKFSVGDRIASCISTGNTPTGARLVQNSGNTIVAEKLNYLRYISHFRAIHRGTMFQEMRTTDVRKLHPSAWGFVCPVHTPDGGPCGLLNHLSLHCEIPTAPVKCSKLPEILASLGMIPYNSGIIYPSDYLTVMLDGKVIGKVDNKDAKNVVDKLRYLKAKGLQDVPKLLEIAHIPPLKKGPFPGIFLFSTPQRMMRPVTNLSTHETEMIGTLEQTGLEIGCLDEDFKPGITTHKEIKPTNIMSIVANLIPFSNFNQSPRNMYQCQMGKQTMGVPLHSLHRRNDSKMYKLQTPHRPIVRTTVQNDYPIDEYGTGTNAVVAVISYTGYDMEDAMIVNKSAYERGFAHASVYITYKIDLEDMQEKTKFTRKSNPYRFSNRHSDSDLDSARQKASVNDVMYPHLDEDGLPKVGAFIKYQDVLASWVNTLTGEHHSEKMKKSKEGAYVENVKVIDFGMDDNNKLFIRKISIMLRINRNPVIGDKFSSRHGQKGVLSRLYPQEDMPFSEHGMTPDVIINPHAFPSRMTIGMLIESMAGKSGALQGKYQYATPFSFDEKNRAVDHFGEQLRAAGFNYHGNEPFYSGILGVEFEADIFFGVVYYQRLRHMVNDKYQVRANTGPIVQETHQPVKGRKRGGGVRLGEMERDSILAHGAAFLLQDRLLHCSDESKTKICRDCGSILGIKSIKEEAKLMGKFNQKSRLQCGHCESFRIDEIALPYVFIFLAHELAAMNVKVQIDV